MRGMRAVAGLLAGLAWPAPGVAQAADDAAIQARIKTVLRSVPLIDGHNDLPWELRDRYGSDLGRIDLAHDTAHIPLAKPKGFIAVPGMLADTEIPPLMTDIPRLRAGQVGGQFWSVWIPAEITGPRAVEMTLEQIDLVKRMAARYPADLAMAYSAADIEAGFKSGRVASLIGIEGGHQIDSSLPVLRQMYAAGARYMTLTHFTNTPWADSATDTPKHHGLTAFGRALVHEMNRMGMLVDLSHVSAETMRAALAIAQAPVIFSHSSAFALDDTPRNVPDDVLAAMQANGGVVMVNFYPGFVSQAVRAWGLAEAQEQKRLAAAYPANAPGSKAAIEDGMRLWHSLHPAPHASLAQVADHIEYVRAKAGIDHVGLGSDFDGIPNTPEGLDGVDKYPSLLAELARRGWSDADLAKLAGGNLLRCLARAEAGAAALQAREEPSGATLAGLDGGAR